MAAEVPRQEKAYHLHHLERHHFNIQKTAGEIGVARTYLNSIMKRLHIDRPLKAR